MSNRLKQVHRDIKRQLIGRGIESAGFEATLLIEHVIGLDRAGQLLADDLVFTEDQRVCLAEIMARRLNGEPVDHILGHREFYGLCFEISQDVLSPRPETEMIVDFVLGRTNESHGSAILDLGTGSGAIIISILAARANVNAVATDISDKSLAIASKNAETHCVDSRLEFVRSDWFDNIKPQLFDFIVSNPPYITDDYMERLEPEVVGFDPDIALRGGSDGLDAYQIIANAAGEYLKPSGYLALEIGFDQGESVSKLLKEKGFNEVRVNQDLSGHDRMITARFATKAPIHSNVSK